MKVLVIDDDAAIRRLVAAFLSGRGGMTVLQAQSGVEGVSLAERDQPDVILLDAVMPELDGPSTLAELRKRPATASIPVIFLTATTRADERARLSGPGVRGIVTKPFNPSTLAADVLSLLAGNKAHPTDTKKRPG